MLGNFDPFIPDENIDFASLRDDIKKNKYANFFVITQRKYEEIKIEKTISVGDRFVIVDDNRNIISIIIHEGHIGKKIEPILNSLHDLLALYEHINRPRHVNLLNKILENLAINEIYELGSYRNFHYIFRNQAAIAMLNVNFDEDEIEEVKSSSAKNSSINFYNQNLNQILYGPPGTGKTYFTIDLALQILGEKKEGASREENKNKFDRKIKENQIIFTTFHQSINYEDFIEGIKPEILSTSSEKNIIYKIEDGLFKQACAFAAYNCYKFINKVDDELNKEEILKKYSNNEFDSSLDQLKEDSKPNPIILIIDEINRGNVSQIFGELITLIEDDKRLGKREQLTVTLPYSKKIFGVPPNLHIIGTMNTADRSIEALDTALRRRFSFIEKKPEFIELFGKELELNNPDFSVNLGKLLELINDRIEILASPEQQIGPSYFLKIFDAESLANAFNYKIIPLLREYFYDDFGKIGLILGSGFIEITNKKVSFADFDSIYSNEPRSVYKFNMMNKNNISEAILKLMGSNS
jgi:Cdc6-like AAA superfamily ATPase